MRYLGIDYGEKRIGLAISDPEGRIATPYQTLTRTREIAATLVSIVKKENIGKVIVGLPVPFSGGESRQTLKVKKFAGELSRALAIPMDFQNEILTTRLAERSGVQKKHLDASAAALILQSYLDQHR